MSKTTLSFVAHVQRHGCACCGPWMTFLLVGEGLEDEALVVEGRRGWRRRDWAAGSVAQPEVFLAL